MPFNLVRYSQQDPAWKNNKIGGGPDTIGYIGCALTSLAMYASGWGFTETPATLNLKLNSVGGFVDEAIVWGAITKFHPQIQNKGLTLCMNTDAPLAQIDSYLAAGEPVIVEVDYSPAAGLQTHWVVMYAKQGGDYLIQDPWPCPPETQAVSLLSRYAQGKPLIRSIKAVAWYQTGVSVPVPAPLPPTPSPTAPLTPPATPDPMVTDLVLQVVPLATAGIKLHDAPAPDSFASYAEMPGTLLNVIEDTAGAMAKLGKMNDWIYVRDPNGHQGFVAAWYVEVSSSNSDPAPVPAPTQPPAPATPPSQTTPPAPSPAPTTSTPPPGAPERFQVVVIQTVGAAGLAVRQQPSPGADKVNNEKAGARLTVIEPAATALPKIGKTGQWLAVKATNNQRGYVMAQYVQLRQ
jgi:hypothetical protein